jgi:hypothetical protein
VAVLARKLEPSGRSDRKFRPQLKTTLVSVGLGHDSLLRNSAYEFGCRSGRQSQCKLCRAVKSSVDDLLKSLSRQLNLSQSREPRSCPGSFLGTHLWVHAQAAESPSCNHSATVGERSSQCSACIALLSTMRSADTILPTTDGHEIRNSLTQSDR